MNILLIDDHPLYRQGLMSVLNTLDSLVEVVEATTISESFQCIENDGPIYDLVLYDWYLPDGGGVGGLVAIMQLLPETPIVVVSANESEETIAAALSAGACGYIPKSADSEIIKGALTLVFSGEKYVPSLAYNELLKHPNKKRDIGKHLTNRQSDVLHGMARGSSNKQIGKVLGIAETTVRVHVSDILKQLEVHNRTEAVLRARHLGLLDPAME